MQLDEKITPEMIEKSDMFAYCDFYKGNKFDKIEEDDTAECTELMDRKRGL